MGRLPLATNCWNSRFTPAVASTLLKQTTLALAQDDNKVQFAEGPDLKPTHNTKYWAAKTCGFDVSAEDRVPADLYNKILWEGLKRTPAPVRHTKFQSIAASGRSPTRTTIRTTNK